MQLQKRGITTTGSKRRSCKGSFFGYKAKTNCRGRLLSNEYAIMSFSQHYSSVLSYAESQRHFIMTANFRFFCTAGI